MKAINKEKLPQLGHTTGRSSYWLANVAWLLDAILTPGQRIESLVTEGLVKERSLITNIAKGQRHRHSSPTPSPTSLVKW